MAVPTLEGAKTHLNITRDVDDDELASFLAAARTMVEQRVGPLEPTTVTEKVEGRGRALLLSTLPVVSLTSVTSDGGRTVNVSTLSLDGKSGVVTPKSIDWLGGGWTVVYSAGLSSVSDAVEKAVYVTTAHLWQTQRGGGRRPGTGGPDVTVGFALPNMALELIQADDFDLGFA